MHVTVKFLRLTHDDLPLIIFKLTTLFRSYYVLPITMPKTTRPIICYVHHLKGIFTRSLLILLH